MSLRGSIQLSTYSCAGVLAGILRAQQLDVHDIEGIHVLLQTLLGLEGAAPGVTVPPVACGPPPEAAVLAATAPDGYSIGFEGTAANPGRGVESGLEIPDHTADHHQAEHSVAIGWLMALPEADALTAMRHYLIAATAKDCAIMITLQAIVDSASAADAPFGEAGAGAHEHTPTADICPSACGVIQGRESGSCMRYKVWLPDPHPSVTRPSARL